MENDFVVAVVEGAVFYKRQEFFVDIYGPVKLFKTEISIGQAPLKESASRNSSG